MHPLGPCEPRRGTCKICVLHDAEFLRDFALQKIVPTKKILRGRYVSQGGREMVHRREWEAAVANVLWDPNGKIGMRVMGKQPVLQLVCEVM